MGLASFLSAPQSVFHVNSDGTTQLGGEEDASENMCPSLSFEQRLIGFCACLGLGFFFSILAWVSIFSLDFNTFAFINTAANVVGILGTLFLCGPMTQLKRMFDSTRVVATVVYLSAVVLTFVAALVFRIPWLTIITVLVQYVAMIWYCLSYIPFARTAVLKLVGLS